VIALAVIAVTMIERLIAKRRAHSRADDPAIDHERRIADPLDGLVVIRLLYTNHLIRGCCSMPRLDYVQHTASRVVGVSFAAIVRESGRSRAVTRETSLNPFDSITAETDLRTFSHTRQTDSAFRLRRKRRGGTP
jgi:hypothetical protein